MADGLDPEQTRQWHESPATVLEIAHAIEMGADAADLALTIHPNLRR